MDRSQRISLMIVIFYILVEAVLPAVGLDFGGHAEPGQATRRHVGSLLLFVSFACIWWPDVAGAVLLGCRFGPVPDTLAIGVRVLGWIVLVGVILMWLHIL